MTYTVTQPDPRVTISTECLMRDLDRLASFGGRPDGGVDRVAGSAADLAAREWLAQRLVDAGLHASTDDIGNVFGRVDGSTGPWLLVGSHTDTVPGGGRLDGAYGVMAALEVLRTLHENRHPAAESLEIVSFWDEEGAAPTSPGGLTGSTRMCEGKHLAEISGYVELHIEQGARMERAALDLAAVEGIVGIDRYQLQVHGTANHAGTTPMDTRSDAGRAAALICSQVKELAIETDPEMVANVGCLEFSPNAPNVIPGLATLTVEFRARRASSLRSVELGLKALSERVAAQERCTVSTEQLSHKPVISFDSRIVDTIEGVCVRTGKPTSRLWSLAGHDASVLASCVPTGMIFVPSTHGISHQPDEFTPAHQLALGCQALCDAVIEIHRSGFLQASVTAGRNGS